MLSHPGISPAAAPHIVRTPCTLAQMRRLYFPAVAALTLSACAELPTSSVEPPQFARAAQSAITVTTLADPGDGVCTNADCTLREALAVAQPGDRIAFKSKLAGTIALVDRLEVQDVVIDGGGRITLDAQRSSGVLQTTGDVVLTGLTITGGANSTGGGILHSGGHLQIDDAVIHDNAASSGGGIYNQGEVTLRNSRISANTAVATDGGGIYNEGTMHIFGSTIVENGAERWGGGVTNASAGILAITGSLVASNGASTGAGIGNFGGLTVRTSTIAGNIAGTIGAGIYTQETAVVEQSTLSGNHAVNGSAIYTTDVLIVRSTTITRNGPTAVFNGGKDMPLVSNTIIAGNTGEDCWGGVVSLGHTISVGGICGGGTGTGDRTVAVSQVFSEVIEEVLRDNGGPTMTHAPIERGRAIDAGYCPGIATDQRGFPRPWDDTRMPNAVDGCDIGAVEWQAPPARTKGSKK
jgi:CSLREA domain-containing protein